MKRTLIAAALAITFAGAAYAKVTELVVYKDANFRGPSDTIKGEVADLEHGFGRQVSSLIARGGAWEVCTGDHFKGRCRVIPEGEYPTLGRLNERIVSVRFLGDDPRFRSADVSDLRDGGRDARREERRQERLARREAWDGWREYSDARRDWDSDPAYYADRTRTYR